MPPNKFHEAIYGKRLGNLIFKNEYKMGLHFWQRQCNSDCYMVNPTFR